MSKKNIWILNHYALTPDMSGGTRHYDFAKELIARGYSVTIIASSFHYSKYQEMKQYNRKNYLMENMDGIDFLWIKTPSYFGNGFGRVKNMLSYMFQGLRYIPKLDLKKPDVVIGSSVHLFAVFAAYRLSLKYKAPFIMEVRDLWPQTLIDMGIPRWHPFIIFLGLLEKFLYKKADKIISNLPYAFDYMGKFVKREKFEWISNGVDTSQIRYVPKEKTNKFIVSYTGAIGKANNLQILLDVAKRLKHKKKIYFRIVGAGAQKEQFEQFAKEQHLENVSIEKPVPKNEVASILQGSDVLFLSLMDSPLYKYGISLNKLFDYMASGRVIVFVGNSRNNPIQDSNAGYCIIPDDIESLESVLLKIYSLSEVERSDIGIKIRRYVQEHYSIPILVDKLEKVILEACEKYDKNSV